MGGVYTIYAYFNSEQIQAILNSVVMLVGSSSVDGDYLSIIRVAAMMGLLMAVCYGFVRARGEDAGQYLLMVALFYSTLFVPRVTVSIEEHGGAGGGAPIVVDNVPLGLAFFASTTSHIGYWLTDSTETFFSLPDTSLRLSAHGLMGGVRALRLAQSAAVPDPVLAQDLINFMRDCINPELAMNPTYVSDLLSSTNIWNDVGPTGIGVLNPGRMVTLSGALGAQACDVAYSNTLNPLIAPAATSEFARIAKMLSPNASAATANTMLASLLPAAEGLIMAASASTTEAIRQRMMLNMFNDTSASMAQILNDPSAAQTAIGAAMAASSANTSYAVMAKLAQETLPLVRNSIELVIIGVFPIVLILIIIAGSKGGVVLRSYVMTMLWVQLWAPLYAIVNYVGTMAGAKSLKAALAGVDGVSVVNAAQLLNTTISSEAIAGMLTISVPMIALAIVKGGEVAMSGIVSGITGPANSAASSAGGQVGTGNVSMGNLSWGNFNANTSSANKHDTNMAHRSGMASIQQQNGDVDSFAPSGRSATTMLANSGPLTAKTGASAATGFQEIASAKFESGMSHSIAARDASVAAMQGMIGTGADHRQENFRTNGWDRGNAASEGGAYVVGTSDGQTSTVRRARDSSSQVTSRASGGIGGGGGGGGGSPVSGSLAMDTVKAMSQKIDKAKALNDEAGVKSTTSDLVDFATKYADSHGFGDRVSGGNSRRSDVSASLSSAKEHVNAAQASFSEAKTYSEQANRAKTQDSGVSFDPVALESAAAYKEHVQRLNSAPPQERSEVAEGVRSEVAGGEPQRAGTGFSSTPFVWGKEGVRADYAANSRSPDLADDTKQRHEDNQKAVGVSPKSVGQGSVPISESEKLNNMDAQSARRNEVGVHHRDAKQTAKEAATNVMDSTGLDPRNAAVNSGEKFFRDVMAPDKAMVAQTSLGLMADIESPALSALLDNSQTLRDLTGSRNPRPSDMERIRPNHKSWAQNEQD